MYLVTVHPISETRPLPVEPPPGHSLHSFAYASPERIVCMWQKDILLEWPKRTTATLELQRAGEEPV